MLLKLLFGTFLLMGAAGQAQSPYSPPTCASALGESGPRSVAKYLEALSVERGLLYPTETQTYTLGEIEWTVHYITLPAGHWLDPKKVEQATHSLEARQLGNKWAAYSYWQLYVLSLALAGTGITSQLGAMWQAWEIALPYLNAFVEPMSTPTMTLKTACAIGLAALAITSYTVMQSALSATSFLSLRGALPDFEPALYLGVYNNQQRDRLHRFFSSGGR